MHRGSWREEALLGSKDGGERKARGQFDEAGDVSFEPLVMPTTGPTPSLAGAPMPD